MNKEKPHSLSEKLQDSVRFIRSKTGSRPKIAIILGSGLGDFGNTLSMKQVVDNSFIPHYPQSTIEGHSGRLIFGKMGGKPLLVFQGRVHYYETGKIASVLYPIYVAHRLGIRTLIVTNAAGGVNREFKPADLMLMTDQINLTFENPLGDPPLVPRHRKNAPLYDDGLQQIIRKTADKKNIVLRRGVYCGITGPSYETAAEVKMVRLFGGDAVGMSTVNEVTLAQSLGMRVAGISCITNLSTGISDQKLSHAEVTEVADRVKQVFAGLLRGVIEKL